MSPDGRAPARRPLPPPWAAALCFPLLLLVLLLAKLDAALSLEQKRQDWITIAFSGGAEAPPPPPPDGFSAVAVDLDGTLLDSSGEITSRTIELIRELTQSGVRFFLATGRSLPACRAPVRALALPVPLPVVCYNGARGVVFPPGGRADPAELFETTMPRPQREAVLQFAAERGAMAQYYHGEHIYVKCETDEHRDLIRRYREASGVGHTPVASYEEVLHLDPCKVLIMTDDPDGVVAAAKECFPDGSLTIVRGSPPFFVEFLPPGVCKRVGFERMCQELGVLLGAVVAFGDGDNDVGMLRAAGVGFAMRNAREAVRSQAPRVTERTNTEDGVAWELSRLLRDGRLRAHAPAPAAVAMAATSGEPGPPAPAPESASEPAVFIESPFTAGKVATTMLLWVVTLAVVGVGVVPLGAALAGMPARSLSPLGTAELLVAVQAAEIVATFAVFSWALKPYRPLPPGWFQYNREGPFGRRGWLTWAGIGILVAPLALLVGAVFNEATGQTGTSATVEEVASMVGKSGASLQAVLLLLSGLTAVLAPLMEEFVFRGFLLPALTRWVSVPAAVILSSAAFAAAHLSVHDFVPLFLLGSVMGTTYVQTRDLLAPTLVHCAWNLLVLLVVASTVLAP